MRVSCCGFCFRGSEPVTRNAQPATRFLNPASLLEPKGRRREPGTGIIQKEENMIRDWEILSREVVNDFGIVKIRKKQARSPRTGGVSDILAIDFPDWALVLAITAEEAVVMVRQYRHGIEQVCLELPGGLIDPEDSANEEAARRELLEETGYHSSALIEIGRCYPQPAVLSNRCFFFLAENAEKIQEPQLDEGEDIEILKVPLKEIPSMIEKKEINHGMVLLAFYYYWTNKGHLT